MSIFFIRWLTPFLGFVGAVLCSVANHDPFQVQIRYLSDVDPLKRAHAARILGEAGPEARVHLPHLRKALLDCDPFVRVRVAEAIWRLDKDKAMIAILIDELNDNGSRASRSAIVALSAMGSNAKDALPRLQTIFRRESSYGKILVASGLAQIEPTHKHFAISVLRKGLKSEISYERLASAEEAAKLGNHASELFLELCHAVNDEDENVRVAVKIAIDKIRQLKAKN